MTTTQIALIVGPQAQKSILTIGKASVKKQLLSAEFTEQLDLETKPREFQMQGRELVHPDLEKAFARLVPHFYLLTEQLEAGPSYWPAEDRDDLPAQFDSYGVTGLIIGAKDGVTLVGFRQLENGKVLNLTAQYVSFADPSEQFEESDAWRYVHTDKLKLAVESVLDEVDAALRGKCSDVGRQLGMFEQPREVEMGEAVEPRKAPAKPRTRKLPAGSGATAGKSAGKPASKPRRKKAAVEVEATAPAQ